MWAMSYAGKRYLRLHGPARKVSNGPSRTHLGMAMIRILLVDDHDVTRMGLKRLFEARVDMEVVAEARTGEEALALVRTHPLDLVLLDLSLKDASGIDVMARCKAIRPDLPILIVSGHAEDQYAINL